MITEAVVRICARFPEPPQVGVILGSGLGPAVAWVEDPVSFPYAELPGLPAATVPGHRGRVVLGRRRQVRVAVMEGRLHVYEGYNAEEVSRTVQLLSALGTNVVVMVNAAGAIAADLGPGDVLRVRDHINLIGDNPLRYSMPPDRFVDLTEAYDLGLRGIAAAAAKECGLGGREGVLAAVLGPSYETPAEVEMLRRVGADAVCMSTVPEVIMARALGLRVAALSLITNRAAGSGGPELSHREVVERAEKSAAVLGHLLQKVVEGAAGAP